MDDQETNHIPSTQRETPDSENNDNSTSTLLTRVVEDHEHDVITLGQMKDSLHERGFGVLMALAALPLCIPVPVPPGYTTVFSIPLFILSLQMIFGRDAPWLPKWLERKEIKRASLGKMVERAVPLLRKIEKLLKPRMKFVTTEGGEKLIGIVSFVCAISIAVPLPLTNLPPGYGILIMSLGLLSKDGVTVVIGIITGITGCIITALILHLGADVIDDFFTDDAIIISMLTS